MHTMLQDLRFATRQLLKSPGFTLAAVLTLTIGIGANTALFSSMDAVVMHPVVVPQLDRVMAVSEEQDGRYHWATLGNFEDWNRQSRSFEQMAVFGQADMSLTGAGDAAHVEAARTSANFFSVLETPAFLGRTFLPAILNPAATASPFSTMDSGCDSSPLTPTCWGRRSNSTNARTQLWA